MFKSNLIRRNLFLFFCIQLCSGAIFASMWNDSLSYPLKITIASEPDYPPYCMVDENGNADGFSVELFKAAASAVGIDVTIKIGVWNQIKQDLANGVIDALPLVGRTPEREALYEFTMPYLRLQGAVFAKFGTKDIKTKDDLKNKVVAVMKGDNAEEYLHRNNLFATIIPTHTFEEAFRLLDAGKVDAVLVQRIVGIELIKSLKLKHVIPLDLMLNNFRQDFCFAVTKGNKELNAKLNEGLSIVIANNTYDEIHLKWFGPSLGNQLSFKIIMAKSLKYIISSFIILLLFLILFMRYLINVKTIHLKTEVHKHEITNQALNRQQLLLEKMEKVGKIGGWDYDLDTKKISWTKGVYDIYGVSPTAFNPADKNLDLTFYHPDDLLILEQAFEKTIQFGEPYDLQLRFNAGDGAKKWVWTSGQAEYENGKMVRVYGSIMDISDWKKAVETLMHTQSLMYDMGKLAKVGGWEFDTKTGKGKWTDEVAKIHDLDPADEPNVDMGMKFYINESRKIVEVAIKEAIEHGKPYDLVLEMETAKGNHKWVRTIGNPTFENGKVIRIGGSLQDITELKESEMELRKLKDNLEIKVAERTCQLNEKIQKLDKSQQAMLYMVEDLNEMTSKLTHERKKLVTLNKELEAFSYSVSHDLRAPLRAIDSFTKILLDEYGHLLDAEAKRLFTIITDNAQKMGMLIDDLLNFSRLNSKELNFSRIDMHAMALAVFNELEVLDNHAKIEFNLLQIPEVYGDDSMLKQVWINLIGNAIKFSSKKSQRTIEIGCTIESDQNVYYIKDSGDGFDMVYVKKLFGVFQRLHSDKEFEGTGVGLAIVQRIISRMGGRVWAEGKIGQGATFYFTLPNTLEKS